MNSEIQNRKTVSVPTCPACGGEGKVNINDAKDYVTSMPGVWTFRQCTHCETLWQDPCTIDEDIGKLYPDNYGFTRQEIPTGREKGFKASVKAGVFAYKFGYAHLLEEGNSKAGLRIARILSVLPGMQQRAGRNIRYLSYQRNGRLLDVGSGNGAFLQQMQELGWQVEGIEPDPKAAAVATKLGFKVMPGTIEHTKLPDSYYDAVALSHVMEHFRQPQAALQKIIRCLKPGGVLVSISPNPAGFLSRLFQDQWYELDAPRHLVIPSPKGCRIMCEKLGFEVKCWTANQLFFWIYRECLSIRKTGKPGRCQARFGPKILSILSSIILPIFPNTGEEVVCYAVKK